MGEFATAEQIRGILLNEQDHQIDLATALGVDALVLESATVPAVKKIRKTCEIRTISRIGGTFVRFVGWWIRVLSCREFSNPSASHLCRDFPRGTTFHGIKEGIAERASVQDEKTSVAGCRRL